MAAAKSEVKVCEDMISTLPDELLVTILLLLPIKDAVATMILSKRWQFVWTMLPKLRYGENGDGHYCSFYDYDKGDDDDDDKSNWCFFEKSMELHKAPVLQTLFIKLGRGCPSDADVGKYLTMAVHRRVVHLKFRLCWSKGPTRLPKSLYACETLRKLTLSNKFLVDFPASSCLPSLLDLSLLHVVYKDDASLVRFLSSCPLLHRLCVMRNKKHDNVASFSVKVPSLRCLHYMNWNYTLLPVDSDVVDTCRSLVIDTPELQDIQLADFSGDPWSIENMPCLERSCIDVLSFPDIDKSKLSLFRVSSLQLFMSNEVLVHCSTIKFSDRLIKLEIYPQDSDWIQPLLFLLENAPKLQDLLVNYEQTCHPQDRIPLLWNQPSSVPRCMSSYLEIFGYSEYGDREEEEKFLTYILSKSKCLRTVTISVRRSFNLEKKNLIIKKLRNIPRASTISQLLFK